jgi:hypothetical protein
VTERKDLGGKFPEVKAPLDAQEAIIDGEIVALNEKDYSSFQALRGFDMGKERLTGIRTTNVLIGDHNKISLYGKIIIQSKTNCYPVHRTPGPIQKSGTAVFTVFLERVCEYLLCAKCEQRGESHKTQESFGEFIVETVKQRNT